MIASRYQLIYGGRRRPVTVMTDIDGETTHNPARCKVATILVDTAEGYLAVAMTPGIELLDSDTMDVKRWVTIVDDGD